ncbi:MAG: hypothetical protein AB1743_01465 [Actinomycetota bacterium]
MRRGQSQGIHLLGRYKLVLMLMVVTILLCFGSAANALTGAIVINSGAAYTASPSVTLAISATDPPPGSGVSQMRISNNPDLSGGTGWIAYATSRPWTLQSIEGTRTVYIQFKDRAGNLSSVYSDSIFLDTNSPTATTFLINDGAEITRSRSVTLTVSAYDPDPGSGIKRMMISNYPSFYGGRWYSYSTTKAWKLDIAEGTTTVYIKFEDNAGNTSTYSDQIFLDTKRPVGQSAQLGGAIRIDNNAYATNDTTVTLSISAFDLAPGTGVSQMRISNNPDLSGGTGWIAYATSYNDWVLNSSEGTQTVYIQFKDGAGNESLVYKDSIILDTVGPTGSVLIEGGSECTRSRWVTLSISANDTEPASGVRFMRISNHSDFSDGTGWKIFSATKRWKLDSTEGTTTVYIQFMDRAGNISPVYSDEIFLDTKRPVGSSLNAFIINDREYATNTTTVSLSISAYDPEPGTGVVEMMISNNYDFSGATWEAYATSRSWELTPGDGIKIAYIKFRDLAGNESFVYSDDIFLDTVAPTP